MNALQRGQLHTVCDLGFLAGIGLCAVHPAIGLAVMVAMFVAWIRTLPRGPDPLNRRAP